MRSPQMEVMERHAMNFIQLHCRRMVSLSWIRAPRADAIVFQPAKCREGSFLVSFTPKFHEIHLSEMQKSSQGSSRSWVNPPTSIGTSSYLKSLQTLAAADLKARSGQFGCEEGQRRQNLSSSCGFSTTSSGLSVVSGDDGSIHTWRECRLGLQETRRKEEFNIENSGDNSQGRSTKPLSAAHSEQWSKITGRGREEVGARICRLLTGKKWWGPDIISGLERMNLKLSPYIVAQVLKQQQRVQVALGFFYWAKEQEGYKHNTCVYNTLVGIVGSNKDFVALRRLMEEMQQENCLPNAVTYTLVIRSFGAKTIDKALDTFEHMHEVGCPPDVTTYNCLIDLLIKSGDDSKAWSYYQRMLQVGLVPDRITHNILYSSLVKSDRVDEACLLSKAYLPVSKYNSLIHFLGRAGKLGDALKVFDNMKGKVKPDNFTYSSLITFFGKGGDVDSAWALFQKMENTGCIPDVVVYSAIMKAFRKTGQVDQVLRLFQGMKEHGCEPDRESYTDVIHSLVEADGVDQACTFLEGMVASGFEPKITTYSDVLWMLGKAGKVDVANKVFEQMKGIWRKPRVNAYHSMIVAFSLAGQMEEALRFFRESKDVGCIPVSEMYSDLIHGLCKVGNIDSAHEIFIEMTEKGFFLDLVTCNVLINSLCKAQRVDEALQICQKMPESGCIPDVVTYTTLIQGLGELGQEDLAFTLFHGMKEKGYKPNVITFNTLIHFLCKRGKSEEAIKLFEEMRESGCAPNDFTLAMLEPFAVKKDKV